jgi:DNA-binding beta-propeller fold protein YncE
MKSNYLRYILVACAAISAQLFSVLAADGPYHELKQISLRSGSPCTSLAIDETAQRLYAVRGNRIEVIDLNKDMPVGAVTEIQDIRGFTVAPNFHTGYACSGKLAAVGLVDLINLRMTAKMKTGQGPTAVLVEPSHMELYALNPGNGSVTIGEADDGDFLTNLDLGGVPTALTADPTSAPDSKTSQVLCALEDKDEIVAINVAAHRIETRWPVAPGRGPAAMAFDRVNHRLLVACTNKTILTMDPGSGKVLATAPIGEDVGECVFDPETQYIFVSGGDGTITILHQDSSGQLTVVQTLKTTPSAKAVALNLNNHRIYVAPGNSGFDDGGRPLAVSGKVGILVFGR